MQNSETLTLAVIEAIAAFEGVEPTELRFTLYDHIDPDVLDQLESDGPDEWVLEFVMGPYTVKIDHDSEITVRTLAEFGG